MPREAAELARRLAANAEAVCRTYLANGRRQGRYWLAGDVHNTPGRSLFVRLTGPDHGPGAAGRWQDAATGEHGDLLELIRLTTGLGFREACAEAIRFLGLPPAEKKHAAPSHIFPPEKPWTPALSTITAKRLFQAGSPLPGTQAEAYLQARGLTGRLDWPSLRFHPTCFYREDDSTLPQSLPALLAAVSDLSGHITGIQRTWLDPTHPAKASIATPRRCLGALHGKGVWFSQEQDKQPSALIVGEGVETILSVKSALPWLPAAAALSAGNLGEFIWPVGLSRLYIACDNDPAGRRAEEKLRHRAKAAGIEVRTLVPVYKDWNDDLTALGPATIASRLKTMLAPEDANTPKQFHVRRTLRATFADIRAASSICTSVTSLD